jgi:hypothetical protein
VLRQRGPAVTSQEVQRWVLAYLPVRDAQIRTLTMDATLQFLKRLPQGDPVLIVLRTEKGLECLTPGFTARPSLWVPALERLLSGFPTRLLGRPEPAFALPPSPPETAPEGMQALLQFEAKYLKEGFRTSADDVSNKRSAGSQNLMALYPPEQLGGWAQTVVRALGGLETMVGALGGSPIPTQLVLFSNNEIEDLADPAWRAQSMRSPNDTGSFSNSNLTATSSRGTFIGFRDTANSSLQIDLMNADIQKAIASLTTRTLQSGVTVHTVGGTKPSYLGAFQGLATGTGGNAFNFHATLPPRLSQNLLLWAARYELEFNPLPEGPAPQRVELTAARKGLKLYAPTHW